jgi:hypothetical protein
MFFWQYNKHYTVLVSSYVGVTLGLMKDRTWTDGV